MIIPSPDKELFNKIQNAMALIKCSECGNDISDKATKCIHCGSLINTELDSRQSNDDQYADFEYNKVSLINEITGDIQHVKFGFNWMLFLFSSFLGIPCFYRKLKEWGIVFLVIWAVNRIEWAITFSRDNGYINRGEFLSFEYIGSFVINNIHYIILVIGLSIYMGIKGNELTVKKLLETAYKFINPDSAKVKRAKIRFSINN